jgi:5'-nucleotidase
MRILLCNDDGILAPGLAALYSSVADLGEVTVVAPDSAQSAAGHSITVAQPLTVQRIHVEGPVSFDGISVDGRPADCVRLAVFELLEEPPDLVLSGINFGANVGIHVFYSGTVAAAAEATMFGIPAVAFSASRETGNVDFPKAAGLCRVVLDRLVERGLAGGDLINVNIPALDAGRPKGVRVVRQSTVELRDVYTKTAADAGRETYEITDFEFAPGQEDTDVYCLSQGYITVTPLRVDMTAHDKLQGLREMDWSEPAG